LRTRRSAAWGSTRPCRPAGRVMPAQKQSPGVSRASCAWCIDRSLRSTAPARAFELPGRGIPGKARHPVRDDGSEAGVSRQIAFHSADLALWARILKFRAHRGLMAKEELLEMRGQVVELLPNAMFRAK